MAEEKSDLSFFKEELCDRVFPFWERKSVDEEYGGFFTCFANDGVSLLSTDKFTWSQGRMVWVLSRMARMGLPSPQKRNTQLSWAKKGVEFLMSHCLLETGACAFLMDRAGNHKPDGGQSGRLDSSLYADCFVVLGLAEYARATGENAPLRFAGTLYDSILKRYTTGDYATDPYPVPKGLRAHGVPMILTNTSRTLANAYAACSDLREEELSDRAYFFACDVLDHFVDEAGVLREFIRLDGKQDEETLLCRYINPGHTVEDYWFMTEEFHRRGDGKRQEKANGVLKNALKLGWDSEFGGLTLFADCEGGKPKGTDGPYVGQPMVKKVREDWGSKLWWPHSEALYASLLGNRLTGDEELLNWYEKVFDYTFQTFPNRSNGEGEWIQIRNRGGQPENRIVALPVKDPFHIQRNLLLIIALLEKEERNAHRAEGAR